MIAALVMAACNNNDELLNNENLNGKVTVTATLPSDAPDSRVALTEDNTNPTAPTVKVTWENTESFSVIRGTENKTYSKSTAGNAFTGDAHATSDGTYYAFYPANESATATNALPYDLSEQTGVLEAAKTYMYAKNETDGKKYGFSHLTALVKFTLTLPEGVTGVTPSNVVICSDKLQPVGTVDLTGDAVAYTASEDAATSITITPTSLEFYAYVTPMSAGSDNKNTFIISMDGSDGKYYSGTLETSKSIEANNLYAASVKMICVEKGDFAMKNGSFMKYAADMTLTAEQKANVAGIVFWTTADMNPAADAKTPAKLTDDKIMTKDFPNCIHGLIVSLTDVSKATNWQEIPTNIANWQTTTFDAADKDQYKSVAGSKNQGDTDPIRYIMGYQNTKILKAYNASLSDDESSNTVLPVSLLETWEATNSAPANTTGWFIPSGKESYMLCYKDVDNFASSDAYTDTKDVVNASLIKVNGDKFTNQTYWTSTEQTGTFNNWAYFIDLYYADLGYAMKKSESPSRYVRAVCAF